MKLFYCDHCGQRVFFENVTCVRCNHVLAFIPETLDMVALEPEDDHWRSLAPAADGVRYRLCENYRTAQVCNWALPAGDDAPLCRSCRLTRVIPDLSLPENHDAWRKLERAKRRLLYTLLQLGLPIRNRDEDPDLGLGFEFLSDAATPPDEHVLTGHDAGVITINIAEADDAEREKRRQMLHEPYRTLLGHMRHEVGHYYWDVIIKDGARLQAFRKLFGNEEEDYAEAVKRHYQDGPPANWQDHFISAYASTHPWEDWAETWAHYLHMTDALETAAASGLTIASPTQRFSPNAIGSGDLAEVPFDTLIEHWLQLAYLLNDLNRSLGLPDGYPFVLSNAAIGKLQFIHETLAPATSEPRIAAAM